MKNLNGCVRRLTRRRLRAFQKKLEPFLPNSLGTETNIQVRREDAALAPTLPPTAVRLEPTRVRLEPENISLEIGQKTSIDVIAENVKDLFSVPILLQYDPRILIIAGLCGRARNRHRLFKAVDRPCACIGFSTEANSHAYRRRLAACA